jgi:large subunit ribosomal protein L18
MNVATKVKARERRHRRVRRKIQGTADRPRLCVFRSSKYIYGQAIDDLKGHTLACASSSDQEFKATPFASKCEAAAATGKLLAQRLKATGIGKVVFDKAGYLYHGRIKAFADGARAGGLEF